MAYSQIDMLCNQFADKACADPESFVRGGPNLITFFFLFIYFYDSFS